MAEEREKKKVEAEGLNILIADLLDHEIRVRDKEEFELKLEFISYPSQEENVYEQEFFFFIPEALQINRRSYSKDDFYRDQTNLIRFKTPSYSIPQLLDPQKTKSPLFQVRRILRDASVLEHPLLVEELKLLGNVVRSYVRAEVGKALRSLRAGEPPSGIRSLLGELAELRQEIDQLFQEINDNERWKPYGYHLSYVDEFISLMLEFHLSFLLKQLDELGHKELKSLVVAAMLAESRYREERDYQSRYYKDPDKKAEYLIYRRGLLKKYVMSVLQLRVHRRQVIERYTQLVGAVAAGVAMFIYLFFLLWWGGGVFINSMPFVVLSVLLYIVKDRIKEQIKVLYTKQASRWFTDYDIDIHIEKEGPKVGRLTEFCSFLRRRKAPKWVTKLRNKDFHTELERARRQEQILYYRRELTLYSERLSRRMRHFHINNILRFNIFSFTRKASSAYQTSLQLNKETGELEELNCPKVYHINVILRTRYQDSRQQERCDLKEFRIILDKNGIKRIESVNHG